MDIVHKDTYVYYGEKLDLALSHSYNKSQWKKMQYNSHSHLRKNPQVETIQQRISKILNFDPKAAMRVKCYLVKITSEEEEYFVWEVARKADAMAEMTVSVEVVIEIVVEVVVEVILSSLDDNGIILSDQTEPIQSILVQSSPDKPNLILSINF